MRALYWSDGRVDFRPDDEFPDSVLGVAVFRLARKLSAEVVGDEGENYEDS